ncbi:hypothetical protein QUA40_27345, partial [Microcoleus sp. Pol11C3]|uniref:hypothetical protein n=1 Tax=Microcoleus sp. Pol11C3 TaxID=3055390 RepID=UPI002FCF4617
MVVHDFGAVKDAVGGSSWQKLGCGWEYLTVLAIASPVKVSAEPGLEVLCARQSPIVYSEE